jgi:hypothetical protein
MLLPAAVTAVQLWSGALQVWQAASEGCLLSAVHAIWKATAFRFRFNLVNCILGCVSAATQGCSEGSS